MTAGASSRAAQKPAGPPAVAAPTATLAPGLAAETRGLGAVRFRLGVAVWVPGAAVRFPAPPVSR